MKQLLVLLIMFKICFTYGKNNKPNYNINTIKISQGRTEDMLLIINQEAISVGKIGLQKKLDTQKITPFFVIDSLIENYPKNTNNSFNENHEKGAVRFGGFEKLEIIFGGSIRVGVNSKGKLLIFTSGIASLGLTGIPSFQPEITANINIYRGGLGSAGNSYSFNVDCGLSAFATVGFGQGIYSVTSLYNQSTSSLIPNSFSASVTYGKSFAYSSVANRANSYGVIGLKAGYIGFSYSNDNGKFPTFGSGRDEAWTGGGGLAVFYDDFEFKVGYDSFSGKGFFEGNEAPYNLRDTSFTNKDGSLYYDQTSYERSLNKSSLYGQLKIGSLTYRAEYDCGGCVQNYIHTNTVDNPKFNYNQKGVVTGSVQKQTP